jgi:hypothetical protein
MLIKLNTGFDPPSPPVGGFGGRENWLNHLLRQLADTADRCPEALLWKMCLELYYGV